MLHIVDEPNSDCTGYLVATTYGGKIRVLANFRVEEDAKRFVRMMRMAGKGPEVGICRCEAKTPLWTPLDDSIQPPTGEAKS